MNNDSILIDYHLSFSLQWFLMFY